MDLAEFLVAAKVATYARGSAPIMLDDGSKELTYEDGVFRYRDRYFGFDPFIGQEVVWHMGHPVWAMNYMGETALVFPDDKPTPARVYAFLRQALGRVTVARPYRGPARFTAGQFEYRDASEGQVDSFLGVETILHGGHEVYALEYRGGLIDPDFGE